MKMKKNKMWILYFIIVVSLLIISIVLSSSRIVILSAKKETRKDENIRDILDNKIDQINTEIHMEEKQLESNETISENAIQEKEKIEQNDMNENNENFSKTFNIDNSIIIEPHIDDVTNVKYITYEDVGTVEENEDAYNIIKTTHEIANKNGYEVRATAKEYHIYRLNSISPIYIETNTNWNGANFIIHDENIKDYETKRYAIFEITPEEDNIILESKELLNEIQLNKQIGKIEALKGYGNCLCIAYNYNKKQYIRSGIDNNSGEYQEDIFRIDNEGNLLNDIKWNFDAVSKLVLIPIPEEVVIIENGNFQTNLPSDRSEELEGYYTRNILCKRSNTILKNINHTLDDIEALGGPYYGFIRVRYATQIEIKDCNLIAHKYQKVSNYDLILDRTTNICLDNVNCEDIENDNRWGIVGSNYTKDVIYKNCNLNRIDAHCGVHNLTIDKCTIGIKGLTLIGSGKLKITNTIRIGGNAFIELREDYGSTWNGEIEIENCKYNIKKGGKLLGFKVTYDSDESLHDYGYEKTLPDIYVRNLKIEDDKTTDELIYIFYNDEYYTGNKTGNLILAGYTLPTEIIINNYEVDTEKSIKAFYQDFEGLSNINIKIDIPNRPKLEMKTENNIEYINGELTNQNIHLKLETKDKIQNEMQINGQAIEEKEVILKETGNYQIIVTSIDSAGNTIQDQYEVKIDKKEPEINGIEENKIYEQGVTPIIEDENLDLVTLYYNENVVKDYKINTQLTKEGKYKIEATDKAGNKKIVSFEIQSPEKIENIKQYRVKETYITEILPTTTRQEFFKNASLNSKLKIYHEGKEITDVEIIKTGDILRINNQDYTLIVKADPSGDGKTSILDLMKVKRHIIGTDHLNEVAILASDLNEDGKVNIMDAMNFVRLLTK